MSVHRVFTWVQLYHDKRTLRPCATSQRCPCSVCLTGSSENIISDVYDYGSRSFLTARHAELIVFLPLAGRKPKYYYYYYHYYYYHIYIYIYIYIYSFPSPLSVPCRCQGTQLCLRSVFKISCLFLRPRPWQFEI